MDLLRLPFVVLIDVFKNMDFKEKFLISLMSKRARNTLKLTSVIPHFSILLHKRLNICSGTNSIRFFTVTDVPNCMIRGEVMTLSFSSVEIVLREESPEKQLLLTDYLLDTFKNPSISVAVFDRTPPATVLELMKIINQRKLCVKSFQYHMSSASEFFSRILDECTEVTDTIYIKTIFPEDFIYTPPRPFKVKLFQVGFTANWFNLEDFLNCSRIILQLNRDVNRTAQSWNTLFRNWIDSNARLEYLSFFMFREFEFPLMVEGLSNEGIQQKGIDEWIEVKRRDGSEFVIGRAWNAMYIMNKQEHLNHLRRH
uniref:F-box domain-containing protein n=1 Tax=Caenorhabditis tropicalis TaxID=1561998 RepID=A0A1I7UTK7_9PELO